ncbi:hypothetical protein G9A89_001465 [Geosiphon pyriformis]|nr:hypothetical protein G9A89_001465 [Geosiphon pyriformis]
MFKPHFVSFLSYTKAFALLVASAFSVAVADSLMFSQLASLEFGLAKLSMLVNSIVKSVDSLITTFEQFIKGDLVSSSKLGNKVNELMVHLSAFSKSVNKLEKEVVALKTEYNIKNIDLFGNSGVLIGVSNKMFGKLIAFWKFKSLDVKFDLIKTVKWLVRLVFSNLTLFDVIQKMSILNKFSCGLAA